MPPAATPLIPGSRPAAAFILATAIAGCSHVSERVILLPQADGAPSAVEVRRKDNPVHLRLDRPYTVAEVIDDTLRPAVTDAAAVRQRYGALLDLRPAPPQRFVLRFEPGSDRLTAEALATLESILAATRQRSAPDLVVTGHTDRVGTLDSNDRLALARAETVRELLVTAGLPRGTIAVAGRGEREPAVPTADEMAEPRNRRVEVKLR